MHPIRGKTGVSKLAAAVVVVVVLIVAGGYAFLARGPATSTQTSAAGPPTVPVQTAVDQLVQDLNDRNVDGLVTLLQSKRGRHLVRQYRRPVGTVRRPRTNQAHLCHFSRQDEDAGRQPQRLCAGRIQPDERQCDLRAQHQREQLRGRDSDRQGRCQPGLELGKLGVADSPRRTGTTRSSTPLTSPPAKHPLRPSLSGDTL